MDIQANLIPDYSKIGHHLAGKTILITGATSGIGKAVAMACAQHQAQVILLGRNIRKLEAVADEFEQVSQKSCLLYPLNLVAANDEHYQQLAEDLSQRFDQLHGLVHNAATLGNLTPIKQYSPQQWYKVMQTNVNSAFMLTQACLPLLEKADSASIVWTSSGVATQPKAYWGAYAVSKSANESMMKIIAAEYEGSSIRSNAILPGVVATGMRSKAFPAEDPNQLKQPKDIVNAWLYLLSNDSQAINGLKVFAQ